MTENPRVLPGALPLVGHLPALVRRPLELLRAAQAQHDVVRLRLGTQQAYFVGRPEHLRTLLVTDPVRFTKGVQYEKAAAVVGNSLPVSSGVFHRRQRKMIRPAFASALLRKYFDVMRECSLAGVSRWSPDTDVSVAVRELVGTITAKALFSQEFPQHLVTELIELVDVLDKGVILRTLDPTGVVGRLPLPVNRRFERARTRTRTIVEGVLERHREPDEDRQDLMSTLMAARENDSGKGMPEQQLRDESILLIQAGLETTAQALNWCCFALSERPELQRRLCEEIGEVVSGDCVGYDDVPRLDLTRRVITEALRRYPPLYLMTRRAIDDVQIGSYTIPGGSTVLFSPYALHHDPAIYPEPDRFDPDRWLPGGSPEVEGVSYLPFGAGLRSCIGERFAMTEMILVMSVILQRWSLERDPAVAVRPKLSFVMRASANGVRLARRSDREGQSGPVGLSGVA